MTVRDLCETVRSESRIVINSDRVRTAEELLLEDGGKLDMEVVSLTHGEDLFIVKAFPADDDNKFGIPDRLVFDLSDFEKVWNDIEKDYRKNHMKDKKIQGDIDWLAARIAQFGQHILNCSEAIATEYYDRKDDSYVLSIDSVVNNDDETYEYPYIKFMVS